MGITRIIGRTTPPPTALPLAESLRIYLYQWADAGALTREQADALVGGELSLEEVALPPGPAQFVADCQTRLFGSDA